LIGRTRCGAPTFTYIPLAKGFVYLVAVMDWFSRRVLAWRLSTGMDSGFCVEALQEALDCYGSPEVFNSDQGVQFTSAAFTGVLGGERCPYQHGWQRPLPRQHLY
jgi:putative transposase